MKTNIKIKLAQICYSILHGIRAIFGKNDQIMVQRSGLKWALDISEGIDFSIYVLGAFEINLIKQYSKIIKPGDTVLDIGANCGSHTLHFAKYVRKEGRVIAFEPTDYAFKKLSKNVDLNPHIKPQISVFQIQLSDSQKRKQSEIHSSWPLNAENINKNESHMGVLKTTEKAGIETLDEFLLKNKVKNVHFIKIDVDGNEPEIINGAKELLTHHQPYIVMEISPSCYEATEEKKKSFLEMLMLLSDMGYSASYDINGEKIPLEYDYFIENIGSGASRNVFLEPKNRIKKC